MDKKLKKKVETQLISAMEGILSRISLSASNKLKKKIKEAGKMVARKFVRTVDGAKKPVASKIGKAIAKKPFKKPVMPKRDANGKFIKRK